MDEVEGSARLSALTQFYYRASLQKHLKSQLVKAAEKRGFVDFIISADNQAICCKNNPRLTQTVKNTTELYSNYRHNGGRQKTSRLLVFQDIYIYIFIYIYEIFHVTKPNSFSLLETKWV